MTAYVVPVRDGVIVNIKVIPRARRNSIEPPGTDDALRVRVTAPPDDGKANAALIALLAEAWDVPRSTLTIAAGTTSRRKRIHVRGEPQSLLRHVAARVNAS
ncbi:MAG TPA: DUF167 family protein [Alphaproteobacteria bacterium]